MCSRKDSCTLYSENGESVCEGCPYIKKVMKTNVIFQIALAVAVCLFVFTSHVLF